MASHEDFSAELSIEEFPAARVQSLQLKQVLVLTVGGRVSYRNAPRLREIIFWALAKKKSERLVIDLGSVEAMDTAGAAIMVESVRAGRKEHKEVLLCTPSPSVMNMFRLAGLSEILDNCCASRNETMKRLQDRRPLRASKPLRGSEMPA